MMALTRVVLKEFHLDTNLAVLMGHMMVEESVYCLAVSMVEKKDGSEDR